MDRLAAPQRGCNKEEDVRNKTFLMREEWPKAGEKSLGPSLRPAVSPSGLRTYEKAKGVERWKRGLNSNQAENDTGYQVTLPGALSICAFNKSKNSEYFKISALHQ